MAGKTKSMSQIKQLLLLKKQNVSNRKAATQVGMDKETVNNYVRKAKADPLGIDGLLKLDDPVLERTEDFVYAISQYFKHIGGVSKILVPDNLKAAIIKTDRYEPTVNRILEDLANHYGCFILSARPLHPQDKSLVEDHVKLVYQRVYAELRNMTFFSLEELNKAAAEKMKAHNQKRMLQHPYTREERFLAVDRPNLLPLPAEDFEIRCYTDMKVAPNCCIYLGRDKHYYSVPFQHIGKKVHVEYTRTIVKVYSEGQLVATHKRDYAPGKYTIVNEHLASNSREYRNRTPERYIERCENMLPELGLLVRMMFMTSKLPPEMHYEAVMA